MVPPAVPAAEPPPEDARSPRTLGGLVALLVLLGAFVAGDFVADSIARVRVAHAAIHAAALSVALVGIVAMARQLQAAVRRAKELHRRLLGAVLQLERARDETRALRRRVGRAIEAHFDAWGLTSAERQVAVLVLRGMSYGDVARARGTAEGSVRRMMLGVYRKAGVAGRAEMAALFLRDMLAPAAAPAQPPGAPTDAAGRPEPIPAPVVLPSPQATRGPRR